MKKVLLTSLNARFTHSNLALYYLRDAFLKKKYEVQLSEFSINQNIDEIYQFILDSKPEIVAFSIYIWNSVVHQKIIKNIKKIMPNLKIIVGGPEVTFNYNYWYDNFPEIDLIVRGNGEEAIWNEDFDFSSRKVTRLYTSQKVPANPYTSSDLLDLKKKYIYYEASRGCIFKCSYCLSSRSEQHLVLKPVSEVKKDLQFFINHKVKIVKFVDRTFNSDKKFSQDIWKFLLENQSDTKFHFEINPLLLTDDDFEILKNFPNNMIQFEIGIQTVNPVVLKEINRSANWPLIKENLKKLLKLQNIHFHLDQIIGLPFEDFFEVKNSFNEIISLNPNQFQVGFLKILAGTEMSVKASQYGIEYFSYPPYRIIKNKWLSYKEMEILELVAGLVDVIFNSEKFQNFYAYIMNQKFFDSPFDFFFLLARFYRENNYEIHSKWEKHAENILEYFSYNNEIIGQLGMDWLTFSKTNHYPKFLRSNLLLTQKKIAYKIVSEMYKNQEIIENKVLTYEDLRNTVFFSYKEKEVLAKIPRRDKFLKLYLGE